LKRDYERRIVTEKQAVINSIGERLPAEAKKAYKAYLTIQDEMATQTKQANQLLAVTQVAIDSEHGIKRDLELSYQTNNEMAKKLAMYQKTIKELNEQLTRHKDLLQQEIERGELEKSIYVS
jgi:4-diphosphocytidyl-2C-methyl-D-erythritol kinase